MAITPGRARQSFKSLQLQGARRGLVAMDATADPGEVFDKAEARAPSLPAVRVTNAGATYADLTETWERRVTHRSRAGSTVSGEKRCDLLPREAVTR